MKRYILLILVLVSSFGFSQPYFYRYDGYQVKINSNTITLPWAGGLNFIQASNIDLNLDGINDLFVFDRSGNKIRTFINNGTVGAVDYTYAYQYEYKFPDLHDWVLLADYNCDGKTDIFSYSLLNGGAGISVYENTSTTATGLQFSLVSGQLRSVYWPPNAGSESNLYISSVDVPAIADIDGDGDLDIVTFAIGGVYLEYHLNKSKELYGNCDSLKFEVKNHCWGYASESYQTNFFTLDDTCIANVPNPQIAPNPNDNINREAARHSGSCELCIDLNGDGDKDLIAGDISYKNLTMLTNGGTPTAGHFTAIDGAFPANNSATIPVNLTVFPCAYYTDINNDGKNDLIVSPNGPGASENLKSVVYYENIGTNNFPVFQYQQSDVLQDNMIDVGEGAYPALFDYDNDGLKDLFVGNYGYYATPSFVSKIAQFKNTGTTTVPKFELVTRDYNNYSSLTIPIVNMIPTFGDIDADGDKDLVIGGDDGKLRYFQNIAGVGSPANFVATTPTYMTNSNNRTIDVGAAAAPHITDIDGDGKNDLVVGSRNGKLAYYHKLNTTGYPQLDSVTHFFGNINVTAQFAINGNSFPYVYKNNGLTEMLVGTESGYLFKYNNMDANLTGTFNLADAHFLNTREGGITAPTGADVDNDGLWDLFVGNYSGGLGFYKGSLTAISEVENSINWNFNLFPNPANDLINLQIINDKNSLFKVELYSILGQLVFFEQISNNRIVINVENLKQGMYICKVSEVNLVGSSNSGTLAKRLIIKH